MRFCLIVILYATILDVQLPYLIRRFFQIKIPVFHGSFAQMGFHLQGITRQCHFYIRTFYVQVINLYLPWHFCFSSIIWHRIAQCHIYFCIGYLCIIDTYFIGIQVYPMTFHGEFSNASLYSRIIYKVGRIDFGIMKIQLVNLHFLLKQR